MNDYYTHREFLDSELSKLDYTKKINCLEFGTGDGSALIFKKFIDKYDNLIVNAFETDSNWLSEISNKYKSKNYCFNSVNNWDDLLVNENFNDTYDIVFIDQAPWEARIKTLNLMKDKAKIIIIHDYDYFNINVCDNIYSIGKDSFFGKLYSDTFDLVGMCNELPPTLIMYNKKIK